jgi:hypothetical protein
VQLYSAAAGQKEQPVIGSAGEVADQKAVEEYRTRIEDLETRLSEAERNNDEAQKEAIQWEKDSLDEQILKACGFHGRQRKASDDAERFRKGVSMAIDRAIDAIREHHAPLADHLRLRIKCGNFFCYHPDGIPWEF